MSKHNNVNPDHYKVAGREHQGDGILHKRNKQEMRSQKLQGRGRNAIPGAPPIGEMRKSGRKRS